MILYSFSCNIRIFYDLFLNKYLKIYSKQDLGKEITGLYIKVIFKNGFKHLYFDKQFTIMQKRCTLIVGIGYKEK